MSDSLVEGVKVQSSDMTGGDSVVADSGGVVKIDNVAVVASAGPALDAYDAGSFTVTNSLVDKASGAGSHGADIERSSTPNVGFDFTATGLAVLGTDGTGMGLYNDAKATVSGSLFAHSVPVVQETGEAIFVTSGSALTLSDSALVDNEGSGILRRLRRELGHGHRRCSSRATRSSRPARSTRARAPSCSSAQPPSSKTSPTSATPSRASPSSAAT